MTGADTNLIVRFLVRDVDSQARQVKTLLDKGEILYINEVMLSELYWVLVSVYDYSKNNFVRALDALLETNGIRFFDAGVVKASLADYIHSAAGFTDCLIHRINLDKGIKSLTFDKKAAGLKGMKLL